MSAASDRQALIKLFQRYNQRLGILYGKFVKELSKLGVSVEDKLQDEPLFMFDHFPELKTRLSDIISDYKNDYVNLYKQGISSGASLAFGQDAKNLHGYTIYNDNAINRVRTAAINAFTKQRMSPSFGLSLSQKIWNYLQQTKSEFEVAMSNVITDGLKKGTSAAELSRQVRQQLINPDMMYRRYHYKVITAGGKEKDVVKWHKRVIDGSGKVRFVEAPLEQVGRGVYRSSYKNSFRLMRTEINMSYHYANNERWKAEPFVIGMRISLSPEHPHYDMCDELAGDYPKDFNWASWHPQCLCMSSAILCSKEELKEIAKRTAKGEDLSQYKSPNLITKCPDNFNQYIDNQHDKIIAAAERGTLGYYLRDNKKYWVGRFSASERQQMGISEISPTNKAKQVAQMRHAKRTPEQIADIQNRWDKRHINNIDKIRTKAYDLTDNLPYNESYRKAMKAIKAGRPREQYITDLQAAEKWAATINKANIRHEARTAAQAEAIQKRWNIRQQNITLTISTPDISLQSVSSKLNSSNIANGYILNIKNFFGKNSSEWSRADYYASFVGNSTTRDVQIISILKKMISSKYSNYRLEMDSIAHLTELKLADLSVIPIKWKKDLNSTIKAINAHDFITDGFQPQIQNIEYAYNMLQLSKNKKAIAFGLDNISSKMPYKIFTDFEKKIKGFSSSFSVSDKEFFDALPEFIPLYTKYGKGAYFSPSKKHVVINLSEKDIIERLGYDWYKRGLFHHEYGHAMDNLKGWRTDVDFKAVYQNFVKELAKDNSLRIKQMINDELSKMAKANIGTTYSNEAEMLGSLTDCIQAATAGHQFVAPRGHKPSYFSTTDKQMAEFIAHCSENYWSGNMIFERLAPNTYKEMREIIRKKLGRSK